ncbi:hypothetical protein, partial [Salmonella sp. SAL4456]|uniref:hypothetical protein n=1 Tax=Salmonella sp. SAL4456 TaxID=3159911 RepID=UPI00397C2891
VHRRTACASSDDLGQASDETLPSIAVVIAAEDSGICPFGPSGWRATGRRGEHHVGTGGVCPDLGHISPALQSFTGVAPMIPLVR